MAEALQILGFGYRAIEGGGWIDASDPARIRAVGKRNDFYLDHGTLLNILQIPIADEDSR